MRPVDVLAVMDEARMHLSGQLSTQGARDITDARLIEARATVVELISALQHIATFTAYQSCDICNDACVTAHAALEWVKP